MSEKNLDIQVTHLETGSYEVKYDGIKSQGDTIKEAIFGLMKIIDQKYWQKTNPNQSEDLGDRNTAIKVLRDELKARSKTAWSVRGGTGTAYGWIDIRVAPRALVDGKETEAQKLELAELFQFHTMRAEVSIPASSAHRHEYVNRLRRQPFQIAEKYWD